MPRERSLESRKDREISPHSRSRGHYHGIIDKERDDVDGDRRRHRSDEYRRYRHREKHLSHSEQGRRREVDGDRHRDRIIRKRDERYESRDKNKEDRPRHEPYSLEEDNEEEPPMEKPNHKTSGLLAKESNSVNGIALKYVEPSDSCMPEKESYQLFVFEGEEIIEKIDLSSRSWYLLGRDEKICHIVLNGASCSKQHAAIQFRRISTTNKYLETATEIKSYLIDLDSSYGTKINDDKIPRSRYVELKNKDMIQFGGITKREYVLIVT